MKWTLFAITDVDLLPKIFRKLPVQSFHASLSFGKIEKHIGNAEDREERELR